MARMHVHGKNQTSQKQLGSSLRRMLGLFKGQKRILTITAILSMVEAVMITFTTFCICIIYSNFFTEVDPTKAKDFLMNNKYFDPKVVGNYCEDRDPQLALLAYKKAGGSCDDELIALINKKTWILKKNLTRILLYDNLNIE